MAAEHRSYWLIALIAPLVWGTTYSVTQRWLGGADPYWLATLRILIPAVLMLPLVPGQVWREHWRIISLFGVLNIALFTVLLFLAIQRLPGGMAATLVSSMPLQLLLLRALGGQRPTPLSLLAAIGGIGAVALLVWQAPEEPDWTGVAIALLSATSWALGSLLIARYNPGLKPLVLTSSQLAVAGVLLLGLMVLSGRPFPQLDTSGILALIWLGPVGMGVTYFVWFRAVEHIDVSKLAFLGLINPVVAVLAGIVLMNEVLAPLQWLAIALVLCCVGLAQYRPAR